MKTLYKKLPVEFKFFGKPKAFDVQSFDVNLEEFRDEAYAAIPEDHNFPRARCLIDSGINAIKTLLKNIWDTPEKLDLNNFPYIPVMLQVDNNYTAFLVKISIKCGYCFTLFESSKSSNFDEAVRAEKDEMLKKYGFTELPSKQYRVKFENHEASLNERELNELYKEHPEFCFKVEEVK